MQAIHQVATRYRMNFTQGSFSHNVLVMFTGTAIGQFGAVLLAPFLTRIYTPDMFGVLGIFSATVFILSVIAALRYEMAIPLAQTDEDAANVLGVCIVSLLATTALGVLIVAALSLYSPGGAVLGTLAPYRWLLPLGFFCIGAYQTLVYLATRQSAFHMIARTKIYQGGAGPVTQIILGLCGAGAWGLIIGFITGQAMGVGRLFTQLVAIPRALKHVTPGGMKAMAIRFRRFPLLSSWSGVIDAVGSSYLLLVAIPLLYSNAIAGFVFLTDRIIGRPLLLISTSILQVYVGDMSKSLAGDPEMLRTRFLKLAATQTMIVTGWLLLVNLLAPYVFHIIFGDEWQAAVPYLHVLSIAYLPQMVLHALMHTLHVMERQGLSAVWEIGRLIAVASALFISYALGFSALHALFAYSIMQALAQIFLFVLMYRSIQSLQKEHAYA